MLKINELNDGNGIERGTNLQWKKNILMNIMSKNKALSNRCMVFN